MANDKVAVTEHRTGDPSSVCPCNTSSFSNPTPKPSTSLPEKNNYTHIVVIRVLNNLEGKS